MTTRRYVAAGGHVQQVVPSFAPRAHQSRADLADGDLLRAGPQLQVISCCHASLPVRPSSTTSRSEVPSSATRTPRPSVLRAPVSGVTRGHGARAAEPAPLPGPRAVWPRPAACSRHTYPCRRLSLERVRTLRHAVPVSTTKRRPGGGRVTRPPLVLLPPVGSRDLRGFLPGRRLPVREHVHWPFGGREQRRTQCRPYWPRRDPTAAMSLPAAPPGPAITYPVCAGSFTSGWVSRTGVPRGR